MSIQFGVLEYTKRLFANQNVLNGRGGPDGKLLTSGQLVTAGVLAGIGNGFVSGPVEHIRIRASFSRLFLSCALFVDVEASPLRKGYRRNRTRTRSIAAPGTPLRRSVPRMVLRGFTKARTSPSSARPRGTVSTSGHMRNSYSARWHKRGLKERKLAPLVLFYTVPPPVML